jgi:glycosyltransferase involved in cell wall biosynthesis
MRPIRLLTFSTLYPNQAQPHHGVFVENRLRHLIESGEAESTVLAPVPFYPNAPGFGALGRQRGWDRLAHVPAHEIRHGLAVHHPRYLAIPGIGMNLAPALLYHTALRAARRLQAQGVAFDVIDAHYVYPDGVAAVRLGQALGKPVVITGRGSDLTELPLYATPRRHIVNALDKAAALITVSAALGKVMLSLGAAPQKLTVLRNGIDTKMFRPIERQAARAAFPAEGPLLVSVGHLIPRKGHDRSIQALALLDGHTLLIAGEGPERAALLALAARLGVSARVRLLGALPHDQLATLYSAADAMLLSSSREGWANVLLESMACGTPVVASNIPGNPEVVQAPEAGLVVQANTPEGIAEAVRALLAAPPDRAATRRYAEAFSWDATTHGQLAVFRRVLQHP